MCTFGSFSCIRKGTRRAGADTPHPLPPEGGILFQKGKMLHRCISLMEAAGKVAEEQPPSVDKDEHHDFEGQ